MVWKGSLQRTLRLTSNVHSICGFVALKRGREYIIYARKRPLLVYELKQEQLD